MNTIRQELSRKTFKEVMELINEQKKCMLIRPTGFGKTYLMANLTLEFKNVLYLYPLNIIKLDIKNKYGETMNKNTHFLSYRGLQNKYKAGKEKFENAMSKYDLIIFDEAHKLGAPKLSSIVKYLMNINIKACYIGATATPQRSDGFDVTAEIFDGLTISEYTMHDAVEDGLLKKPYYVYSVYEYADSVSAVAKIIENVKENDKKQELLNKLKSIEIEMGNLLNAPDVIRDAVNHVYEKIDYMKFIVFFSEKEALYSKCDEVQNWFKMAYPNMKVRNLIVTSDSKYAGNLKLIKNLENKEGYIDLIFCIDMLNMGYHLDDITGVVMLRGTSSNIIYIQQLGRCLSATSTNTPIVIDFVNNLFRKPYFSNSVEDSRAITDKDLSGKGYRFGELESIDLIIDDKIATYKQIMDKILYEAETCDIEKAVDLYVNRSMPLNVLVKTTKLSESVIRSEFKTRGIVIEE